LEQEVSNLMNVHEELVQSCERRERLERTARTRLQQDCRRFQDTNKTLKEQLEVFQQQLLILSSQQQQQQQNVATGRNQQDMLACLIQQNKELVDANKRQYIEIQAQSATLEEQRIHINVLDAALKRLEEELRQKQLYQKQLQSLMHANEKKEKLQYELDKEISKKIIQNNDMDANNMSKWLYRDKELNSAEASALDHHNLNNNTQEQDILPLDSQRIVNELHARLKLVEHRLIEKEDTIRQLQELKRKCIEINDFHKFLMISST
jgi:angiomotin like